MEVAGIWSETMRGGSLASQRWPSRLLPFRRGLQERRSRRGGDLRGSDAAQHAVRGLPGFVNI